MDVTVILERSSSWISSSNLENTLKIRLVEDAEVSPPSITLFNHPENKGDFRINQGSGYFDVSLTNSKATQHRYSLNNQTVTVKPVDVGETDLVVSDRCLQARRQASARISVVAVNKVQLDVSDKVQKGNSVLAKVRLLDANKGSILPAASDFIEVKLSAVVGKGKQQSIISVLRQELVTSEEEMTFTVTGLEVGATTLIAVASYHKERIESTPKNIQVFPRLVLEPRNITLLIGARFQVLASGGPAQADTTTEYSVESRGKYSTIN